MVQSFLFLIFICFSISVLLMVFSAAYILWIATIDCLRNWRCKHTEHRLKERWEKTFPDCPFELIYRK